MNNVIEFPDKVFPRWEAIAQALTVHLRELGATNVESKEIIVRLQVRWEQLGVPLALPALRLIRELLPGEQDVTRAGPGEEARQIPRQWKSENARTLLKLAKLEYDLSQPV